jgi:hypothetical protein
VIRKMARAVRTEDWCRPTHASELSLPAGEERTKCTEVIVLLLYDRQSLEKGETWHMVPDWKLRKD